jgi:hypothetical protein
VLTGGLFVDGSNLVVSLKGRGAAGASLRIDYNAFPLVLARKLERDGIQIDFSIRRYFGSHRNARDLESRETFKKVIENCGWSLCDVVSSNEHMVLERSVFDSVMYDGVTVVAIVTHAGYFANTVFDLLPPSARGVAVGWKSEMPAELIEVAEEVVYLDDIIGEIEYRS